MKLERNFHRRNRSSKFSPANRGPTSTGALALTAAVAAASLCSRWARADVYGNLTAGGANLNQTASWTDETTPANVAIPGATDIARWDSNSSGGTFTLGTTTSWQGISIANPAAAVIIGNAGDSGNGLTIGASGVDMTAAAFGLTLFDPVTIGAAQNWNVASGQVLTQSGTVNTNGVNLTIAGAGNVATSGIVSGSGSITMSGTGTLSLTATNSYSGGTTINSGTVTLSNKAAAGGAAGDTITLNGGTLTVSGTSSTNLLPNNMVVNTGNTATVVGNGQFFNGAVSGGGTFNVSVNSGQTFAVGSTTMFAAFTGTIEMGSSAGAIDRTSSAGSGNYGTALLDMGTSTATMNNRLGGTFTIGALTGGASTTMTGSTSSNATIYSIGAAGISTVYAGSFTNSARTTALTVTGGTLALTGTGNTFSGGTTITGGTLQIGNGGASSSGSIGTGAVTNNSILTFNPGSSASISISNAISGSGVVNHTGPGTTTLSGSNSYSGGTSITAGTLVAGNTTSSLGTGAVSVAGGTLAGAGTVAAAVTVGTAGQITAGTTGVGTLSLSSLTLNSGSIINTDFVAAGPTNLINITTANGLSVTGGGINLFTVGNAPLTTNGTYNIFQFPSPYTLSVPTNLLTVLNPASGSPTYTWAVNGNDIAVTVSGLSSTTAWQNNSGGSWAVAGNWTAGIPNGIGAIATFASGPGITAPATVTLDGGKTVGNVIFNNTVGNSSNPPTSYTLAPGTGGTLTLDNGSNLAGISDLNGTHLVTVPLVFNSNALVAVTNPTDLLTLTGAISGNGSLTIGGSGTVIVTNTASYLGTTNVSSGTLQVGAGSTGSIPAGAIIDNGTLAFNVSTGTTITNPISGAGSLVQAGAGALIYAGAGTYTGSTSVNAGTLQIGSGGSIGTGPLTVGTGATLDLNGISVTASTLSGGGVIDDVSAAGTPILNVGSGGGSSTFSGSIRNTTGTLGLVKVGGGTLTLAGANSYTGTTNASAGTLVLAPGGVITGSTLIGQGYQVSGGTLISTTTTNLNQVNNALLETAGTITLAALNVANNDGTLFNLSGGVFTATSVTIPRSSSFATAPTAAAPLAAVTGSGLYVHGSANASIGTLAIGTGNSSASVRIDNGSLTVTGETEIGATINSSTRWTILQVNGGTFNSTDTTNGVVLSQNNPANVSNGSATPCDAELYVLSGTANIQKVGFGLATDTVGGKGFLIVAGGILYMGSGGIVQNNTNGYTSTIDLNGGTIGANANWSSTLPMNLTGISNFTFQTANASNGAANISLSGALSGTGSLTETGAGTLTLSGTNTYSGGTTVSAGTIAFASPGALPNFTALNFNTSANGVVANYSSGSTKNTLFTSGLTLGGTSASGWTSKLDLGNNDMVVQNGTLSDTTSQVAQAFNHGGWNGSGGVTSSAAAADTKHLHALGVIQNSTDQTTGGPTLYGGSLPNFDGAMSASSSDVLVKYTYYGDANLDGMVDGSDYSLVDSTVLAEKTTSTSISGWYNGDFNYDGVVNGSDYTLLDNAYNSQGVQIAAMLASPTDQIAGGSTGSSSVPEPTSMGLLALGALGLLGRRKRRN